MTEDGGAGDHARRERARGRAGWSVIKTDLAHQDEVDLSSLTIFQRLALVWTLTQEAWALSGRTMPTYSRADIPGRIWRDGERPPDE